MSPEAYKHRPKRSKCQFHSTYKKNFDSPSSLTDSQLLDFAIDNDI